MQKTNIHPLLRLFLLVIAAFVVVWITGSLAFGLSSFVTQFWPVLIAAAHFFFASGVLRDADQRRNRNIWLFLDPLTWAVGVLAFGLLAVALYWAVHYSRLRAD